MKHLRVTRSICSPGSYTVTSPREQMAPPRHLHGLSVKVLPLALDGPLFQVLPARRFKVSQSTEAQLSAHTQQVRGSTYTLDFSIVSISVSSLSAT